MSATLKEMVLGRLNGRANCPVREHASRLTIAVRTMTDGTIMLHDHAGCATADVIAAVGLKWSDLSAFRNDTPAQRTHRKLAKVTAEQQKAQCDLRISAVCTMLRNVDSVIRDAGEALRFAQHYGMEDSNSNAWDALEFAFIVRRELEAELNRLDPRFAEVHG